MTSNVGAKSLLKDTTLGFRPTGSSEELERDRQYDRMKDKVLEQLKTQFRPEFLNRVDSFVVFRSLNVEEIRQIVDLLLARVREQLRIQQIDLEITQDGQGPHHQAGLRRRLRRATAPARHPDHGRGSAGRSAAAGHLHGSGQTIVVDQSPDAGLTIEPVAEKTPVEAI